MKLFLSLLLATCTSALTLSSPAALQRPSINMPARSLLRMSEEGAKPAASTEPAPAEKAAVDFTPKAVAEPPKEEGIDWSKYSITLSLAAIFVTIKTLSYLGIMDFSD